MQLETLKIIINVIKLTGKIWKIMLKIVHMYATKI